MRYAFNALTLDGAPRHARRLALADGRRPAPTITRTKHKKPPWFPRVAPATDLQVKLKLRPGSPLDIAADFATRENHRIRRESGQIGRAGWFGQGLDLLADGVRGKAPRASARRKFREVHDRHAAFGGRRSCMEVSLHRSALISSLLLKDLGGAVKQKVVKS